jgi:hypothetical protein
MAQKQLVEQKFFLRWINFILYPTFRVNNLSDLKDGYLLVKLCELFLDVDAPPEEGADDGDGAEKEPGDIPPKVKEAVKTSKSRKEWAEHNITIAYNYCERMKADVRQVPAEDIYAGKPCAIVDFLCAIATAVHISEMHLQGFFEFFSNQTFGTDPFFGCAYVGVTGESAVLQWVREVSVGMLPGGMKGFSGWYVTHTFFCLLRAFCFVIVCCVAGWMGLH